ncbi:MAG: phosphate signaling complex protein PhoU [Bacteroidetes bacterium]|nr:phosphate signaling complex protein PhoU [Rhodothermia bacterium]MCS7155632.1 phosphate signaling complex protein PhoU [Bacteroidota bacterium]MCX7906491.1 phosphate signaling complex protein PhoU [Bacteroidota bacterium]MDW8137228.1 phosphate signaling complex protein PhoU [Bacteroidota bacterium]MDW8284902.1 phosphate signaling complex protein PhoU [Bacteroidota bacterium]
MHRHFERELEQLKRELIRMGSLVEEQIAKSLEALERDDDLLAQQVKETDIEVDAMEIAIDKRVERLLALNQPVAIDLRLLIAALKMNNDLERMGDQARNIAEHVIKIEGVPGELMELMNIRRMAELTSQMVRDCLNAFIYQDVELAYRVLEQDDAVDELHQRVYQVGAGYMRNKPEDITNCLHILAVAKNLERIADLATNIAEDVVFLVEARIIKHRGRLES